MDRLHTQAYLLKRFHDTSMIENNTIYILCKTPKNKEYNYVFDRKTTSKKKLSRIDWICGDEGLYDTFGE